MSADISNAELDALLERHKAFWRMEEVPKPLLRTYEYRWLEDIEIRIPLADGRVAQEGELLTPEKMDARRFVEVGPWRWSGHWPEGETPSLILGDFLVTRDPFDLCWTEAIMGCKVYFSSRARWTEEYLTDWEDLEGIRPGPDNKWFKKLLEFIEVLQETSRGRYLVCNPLMRGPIDMARAIVGDSALCLALYDRPDRFHRLFEICTDVTLEAYQRIWDLIPPFRGGWCTSYGIWAPGTVGYTQIDASVLFSPDDFRDYVLPHYKRLFKSRDFVLIHTHSTCHRHVEALLAVDEVPAVQISIDPPPDFGPTAEELMPVFQRVQEVKPLLITGPVTQDELKLMLDTLSPKGLALNVGIEKER